MLQERIYAFHLPFFWHASFNVLLNPLCKLLWVQLFDLSNKNKDKNLRNTFILLSKLYPLIIKRQFSAILLHWFHRFIIWDAEKQWKLAPNFPTTDIFGIATIKIFFNFMKTIHSIGSEAEVILSSISLNLEIDLVTDQSTRSVHHLKEQRA